MPVADDTASVAWELLRVVSGLGSELVERDVCREQLVDGVRLTVGLAERGGREPRTTTIADHGHDLDRLAICVLLVPFAQEWSGRAGAGRLRNDPMIREKPWNGWAGGLASSFA